uniref:Fat storage-inducing transmembrane protein 1-like protein n=1 Tax=Callorhinchus milii TaxID=7868 RepID=V9KQB0_CALMI
MKLLHSALCVVTDQTAAVLSHWFVRRYFQLWLALLVTFTPLLGDLISPRVVFAKPRNYFNVRLVDSAWSWTCVLTGGHLLLTSYLSSGSLLTTLRHQSRLLAGTVLSVACLRTFILIETVTGSCFHQTPEGLLLIELADRPFCLMQGFLWKGYSISSQSFLLTYSSLVTLEELSILKLYLAHGYPASGAFRLTFLLASLLLPLWSFLLVSTTLFFHHFSQKIVGATFAQLCWYLTYKGWFLCRYSPGCPGLHLLRPARQPLRQCTCGAVGY